MLKELNRRITNELEVMIFWFYRDALIRYNGRKEGHLAWHEAGAGVCPGKAFWIMLLLSSSTFVFLLQELLGSSEVSSI